MEDSLEIYTRYYFVVLSLLAHGCKSRTISLRYGQCESEISSTLGFKIIKLNSLLSAHGKLFHPGVGVYLMPDNKSIVKAIEV